MYMLFDMPRLHFECVLLLLPILSASRAGSPLRVTKIGRDKAGFPVFEPGPGHHPIPSIYDMDRTLSPQPRPLGSPEQQKALSQIKNIVARHAIRTRSPGPGHYDPGVHEDLIGHRPQAGMEQTLRHCPSARSVFESATPRKMALTDRVFRHRTDLQATKRTQRAGVHHRGEALLASFVPLHA